MATVSELPSGKFRAQIRRKNLATIGKVFVTRDEAISWGNARESELVAAKSSAAAKPHAGATFSDVVEKYYLTALFSSKRPGTQAREKVSAKRTLAFFGSYSIAVIDGALVQDYLDIRANEKARHRTGRQLDHKVSPNTVRLDKAFLCSVFKFAKRRNYLTTNIMRESFETQKCDPREGRITTRQQVALYEAAAAIGEAKNANQSLVPWLHFMFETGSRPGEAAKIELSWVNFVEREISIPRHGSKKNNPRIILITDDILPMLKECDARARSAGSKYLFFSRSNLPRPVDSKGKPVRRFRDERELASRPCIPFGYYNAWRSICAEAGVSPKINPHIIRHEFICRLFEETDLSDSQIASLVGDVNVLSLEPYKHLRVGKLRGKQDAHLERQNEAMDAIRVVNRDALIKFNGHLDTVVVAASKRRLESGDMSTPMERLRAGVDPVFAIELAKRYPASNEV